MDEVIVGDGSIGTCQDIARKVAALDATINLVNLNDRARVRTAAIVAIANGVPLVFRVVPEFQRRAEEERLALLAREADESAAISEVAQ